MIVLVGAGALGSHVAFAGRNVLVPLRVVDFDRVERKNCDAQVHSVTSVGHNKAQALRAFFYGHFGVRIEAVPHKLVSDNVHVLLGPRGRGEPAPRLVIDCTDNAEARRVIQEWVREPSENEDEYIPCLHGAVSADGTVARIVWSEHFVPDEAEPGVATCEDGRHLPFYSFAASQLVLVAWEFLETGRRRSIQVVAGGIMRLA